MLPRPRRSRAGRRGAHDARQHPVVPRPWRGGHAGRARRGRRARGSSGRTGARRGVRNDVVPLLRGRRPRRRTAVGDARRRARIRSGRPCGAIASAARPRTCRSPRRPRRGTGESAARTRTGRGERARSHRRRDVPHARRDRERPRVLPRARDRADRALPDRRPRRTRARTRPLDRGDDVRRRSPRTTRGLDVPRHACPHGARARPRTPSRPGRRAPARPGACAVRPDGRAGHGSPPLPSRARRSPGSEETPRLRVPRRTQRSTSQRARDRSTSSSSSRRGGDGRVSRSPCCPRRAPGRTRSSSPGTRRRGGLLVGARPPVRGRPGASPRPTTRKPCARRSRRWSALGAGPARRGRATAAGAVAHAPSRAGRDARPPRTSDASPAGSSTSSRSSPRAVATPRSRSGSSSPGARSTTTCRRSCGSWRSARAARPWRPPVASGCWKTGSARAQPRHFRRFGLAAAPP